MRQYVLSHNQLLSAPSMFLKGLSEAPTILDGTFAFHETYLLYGGTVSFSGLCYEQKWQLGLCRHGQAGVSRGVMNHH